MDIAGQRYVSMRGRSGEGGGEATTQRRSADGSGSQQVVVPSSDGDEAPRAAASTGVATSGVAAPRDARQQQLTGAQQQLRCSLNRSSSMPLAMGPTTPATSVMMLMVTEACEDRRCVRRGGERRPGPSTDLLL